MSTPRILDLVKADLDARDAKGRATYGSSLRADSPNDALMYRYEEQLDQLMYARQEIERRNLAAAELNHHHEPWCEAKGGCWIEDVLELLGVPARSEVPHAR